jgi:hypothetical protein
MDGRATVCSYQRKLDAGDEEEAGAFCGILLGAICRESKTSMRDEDKGLKARAG